MNHFDTTLIPTILEVVLLVVVLIYMFWSSKKNSSALGPLNFS